MSLLNDALRKKRLDEQPAGMAPKPLVPTPGSRAQQKRKLQWTVIICVLVMTAATFGGWFYWAESDAASDLSEGSPLAGSSVTLPVESEEKPVVGRPIAGPSAANSIEPKVAAAPVESAPPTVKPDVSPKTKAAPAVVVPPAKVKPDVSPKSRAAVRPEKKTAKIAPRKKSSPKLDRITSLEELRPRASRGKTATASAAPRTVQSESLYKKARQYHRQDRIKRAIALYQEVIKVDPEHHKARFNLSAAFLQIEAYTQAYPIIADLYLREPDNQQVMLNLAIAHIGCGRLSEALDLLNKVEGQSSAPLFEIAFHKGIVYSHMNQAQIALNWYKRAEALRPEDPRLLFNLAVVSDQQQAYKAAVDYYSRHLDHNTDIDALKEKQIRRRIRTLLTYNAESNVKE